MSDRSSAPSAAPRRRPRPRLVGAPGQEPVPRLGAGPAGPRHHDDVRRSGRSAPLPRASHVVGAQEVGDRDQHQARLRDRMSAASAPLNRVFTGTSTAPAWNRPSAATIHSALFGAQRATRSPGSTPEATSAAPNVRASSCSSA